MSTGSAWHPPLVHERVEASREELSTPRPRRSTWLAVLVALLLGLGVGNLYGSSARDRDDATASLDALAVELEVVEGRLEHAQVRGDLLQRLLTEQGRRAAAAEEALTALTRAAVSVRDGRREAGGARSTRSATTLRRWVQLVGSGRRSALVRTYAPGVEITAEQQGIRLADETGGRRAARIAAATFVSGVPTTGEIVAEGAYAAVGYADTLGSGVVAVHVEGGRIVRQWFLLDGGF